MRILLLVLLLVAPTWALADNELSGRWKMTAADGSPLEDLAQDFHYVFQSDGVMLTQTPFAEYEGSWTLEASGQVTLVLMTAMPDASTNLCDFQITDDRLQITNCGNGGPPSEFIRVE